MDNSISCLLPGIIFPYLNKKGLDPKNLIPDSGYPLEHWSDPERSIPYSEFIKFLECLAASLNTERPLYLIGIKANLPENLSIFEPISRILASSGSILRRFPFYYKEVDRAAQVQVVKIGLDFAFIERRMNAGERSSPLFCDLFQGFLFSLPRLWNASLKRITEIECSCDITEGLIFNGACFRIDKNQNVWQYPIGNEDQAKKVSTLDPDGSFRFKGRRLGSFRCLYHLEWKREGIDRDSEEGSIDPKEEMRPERLTADKWCNVIEEEYQRIKIALHEADKKGRNTAKEMDDLKKRIENLERSAKQFLKLRKEMAKENKLLKERLKGK